jgi:hypothetical protein
MKGCWFLDASGEEKRNSSAYRSRELGLIAGRSRTAGQDLANKLLRLQHMHVHVSCLYEWNHVAKTNQVFLYQT